MKSQIKYKIDNNIYYESSPEMFLKLVQLIETFPLSYGQMLRAKGKKRFITTHPDYIPPYKKLYDWINNSLPQLSSNFYKISTKCFWILNGLTDFPECAFNGCKEKFINYNVSINSAYPKFCHSHCKNDPSTIEKRKATCRKNFGVDFPLQSNEIKNKMRQTNLHNLGYASPLSCPKCRELGKQTRLNKYGDENWHNSEKAVKTFKQHINDDPNFLTNIREKTKHTNIKNGHDPNWTNREKSVQTRLNNHNGQYVTEEIIEKRKQTQNKHRKENPNYDAEIKAKTENTNIENYGVPCVLQSEYVKDRLNQWIHDHGGDTNVFQTEHAKQKSKQTMQKNYGVDYSMQSDEIKSKYNFKEINSKGCETKRKNGTFNTSKSEEDAYKYLCQKFKQDDIIRQYNSELYPFNCDFYIKSFDLYIECNFNWTHGGHWYDSLNENDQNTLKKWQDKRTDFYKNAINTWTVRDVNKHQIAIDNNLNYLVFWKLSELESWLSSFTINYDNEQNINKSK